MIWKAVLNLESGKYVKLTLTMKPKKDKWKTFGKTLLKITITME